MPWIQIRKRGRHERQPDEFWNEATQLPEVVFYAYLAQGLIWHRVRQTIQRDNNPEAIFRDKVVIVEIGKQSRWKASLNDRGSFRDAVLQALMHGYNGRDVLCDFPQAFPSAHSVQIEAEHARLFLPPELASNVCIGTLVADAGSMHPELACGHPQYRLQRQAPPPRVALDLSKMSIAYAIDASSGHLSRSPSASFIQHPSISASATLPCTATSGLKYENRRHSDPGPRQNTRKTVPCARSHVARPTTVRAPSDRFPLAFTMAKATRPNCTVRAPPPPTRAICIAMPASRPPVHVSQRAMAKKQKIVCAMNTSTEGTRSGRIAEKVASPEFESRSDIVSAYFSTAEELLRRHPVGLRDAQREGTSPPAGVGAQRAREKLIGDPSFAHYVFYGVSFFGSRNEYPIVATGLSPKRHTEAHERGGRCFRGVELLK
ncbi:hypothetical protein B0H13DRAFT_1877585 [Mycena leptocephala]|nr:hypothetical protein B0H13DRAFT_1877585 [Mycena leptocephala]